MLKSSQPIGDDPNLWMALSLTYNFVRYSYIHMYIYIHSICNVSLCDLICLKYLGTRSSLDLEICWRGRLDEAALSNLVQVIKTSQLPWIQSNGITWHNNGIICDITWIKNEKYMINMVELAQLRVEICLKKAPLCFLELEKAVIPREAEQSDSVGRLPLESLRPTGCKNILFCLQETCVRLSDMLLQYEPWTERLGILESPKYGDWEKTWGPWIYTQRKLGSSNPGPWTPPFASPGPVGPVGPVTRLRGVRHEADKQPWSKPTQARRFGSVD